MSNLWSCGNVSEIRWPKHGLSSFPWYWRKCLQLSGFAEGIGIESYRGVLQPKNHSSAPSANWKAYVWGWGLGVREPALNGVSDRYTTTSFEHRHVRRWRDCSKACTWLASPGQGWQKGHQGLRTCFEASREIGGWHRLGCTICPFRCIGRVWSGWWRRYELRVVAQALESYQSPQHDCIGLKLKEEFSHQPLFSITLQTKIAFPILWLFGPLDL